MYRGSYTLPSLVAIALFIVAVLSGCHSSDSDSTERSSSGSDRTATSPKSSKPSEAPRRTPTTKASYTGNVGTPAYDFALKDEDGNTIRLSDYKGKVIVLDFWATWCPPCRKEIPGFVELQDRYKDKGVEVIGVSFDNSWKPLGPFIEEFGINYQIVMGDQSVSRYYGNITGIPTTFVIDRDGVIRTKHVGYGPPQLFIDAVEEVL